MIVLDTHVLVWYVSEPDKLSKKAKTVIEKAKAKKAIGVSSISVWKIYLLVKRTRLKLAIDVDSWLAKIEELPFIRFIPVDNRIAARSVILPGYLHQDPADRIIISTVLQQGAFLVTSDKRILAYRHVRSIW